MHWTINRRPTPPLYQIRLYGKFDLEECREMLDEVCADLDDYPFCPVLFDDRKLDMSGLTSLELMAVSNMFLIKNPSLAYSKVAILLRSANELRVAGKFKSLTQPSSNAIIDVFHEESSALSWLSVP